ncbi:AP2/ERF and B3 domain-containing transcription repressor RAV2 [Camellia lanceoleosa]|uniref:AP2/ERF and B3 domain-containing transcription repressor RAV2 n=1 Tax=Camellia lanceoleosa TaxID=1840588 RepID=A0ACC0F4B8_9ERIC|nr:AP2/ERF and B3 domain-containing transcription repressor RAV2 [Camellia lanceoleosa]
MSASKEIITSLSDNERKKMKNSDIEEAKDILEEEQSSPSSSPTVVATDQENVVTPIKKRGHLCISEDHDVNQNPIDASSESTSSSNIVKHPQSDFYPKWSSHKKKTSATSSTSLTKTPGKDFLFEQKLSNSDATEPFCLQLPKEKALAHFPSLQQSSDGRPSLKMGVLRFLDSHNRKWPMKFVYNPCSKSFRISAGWKAFVTAHKLRATDMIRFYKINRSCLQCYNRYLIDFEKGSGQNESKEAVETRMIRLFGKDIYEDCRSSDTNRSCIVVENEKTEPVKTKTIRLFGKDLHVECRRDKEVDSDRNGRDD